MTSDRAPDRRRSPRYSLERPVCIEVDSWPALVELYTRDICHDGVFVRSSSSPELHAKVAVHLRLPGAAATLRFRGEVVHVVPASAGACAGFGVHFEGLTREDREVLRQIVAQAQAAAQAPEAIGPAVRRLVGSRIDGGKPTRARRRRATSELPAARSQGAVPTRAHLRRRTTSELAAVRDRDAVPVPRRRRRTTKELAAVQGHEAVPPPTRPRTTNRERHRRMYAMALELTRTKRYADAAELLSRAHALRPDHLETQVLRSLVLARQAVADRDLARARACYQDVLRLEPDNVTAHKDMLMLSALANADRGPRN